jgi:hypothetical protein
MRSHARQGARSVSSAAKTRAPLVRVHLFAGLLAVILAVGLTGCESDEGGRATEDVASAEVFSCPEAHVSWSASKGTCPMLGAAFALETADCELSIDSLEGLPVNEGDEVNWEGSFTSSTEFTLSGGPDGWACSGGWSGASADLTCETAQGSLCVVTLEAACEDVSGSWRVSKGMCFDFEADYTLEQGLSCELSFLQDGAASAAVPTPASIDGASVSFSHAVHGACVGAIVTGSFKGQCEDSCTFEMTRRQ